MKSLQTLAALFLALCCASLAPGQQPGNAAVKYLRADAALRQSFPLPPNAAAEMEKALETPLTSDEEKMVAAAAEAMVELHHGSELKSCDWAMSQQDGPLTNTSHRGAMREIISLAGLRARMRFRDGDSDGGVNDTLAAIAGARHLSVDGSIASVLISNKIEREITAILALNLQSLSPIQLKRLLTGFDNLPRGSDLGTAIEAEKIGRRDLFDTSHGSKTREDLIERLATGIPTLANDRKTATEIVDGCGGTVVGFQNCVAGQDALYAGLVSHFEMAPEEFEKLYNAEIAEMSPTNPVLKRFTPNIGRMRWFQAYTETRRQLLRAAIAVRLDGPGALSQHLDPYDGKPFSYVTDDREFKLSSELRDENGPLGLLIGR